MPVYSINSSYFRSRRIEIVEIAGPCVLVHWSNHRLIVGKHLANTMRVNDFNIREVAEDLEDAPFIWRRLVTQNFVPQSGNRGGDFLWTLLSNIEVLLHFTFR